MKKYQNYLEYKIVKVLSAFIRMMPHPMALIFGRMLGLLVFYVIPIRKRVAMQNISLIFPEKNKKQVSKIARGCYINFTLNMIEFIRMPLLGAEFYASKFAFVNGEVLQQAYEQKKGALCMSGHFGNWELMGAAIHARGYPLSGIARKQRNRLVDRLINDTRKAVGLGVIDLGMAIRGVFRALKENQFIAILADQDARRKGIFIDFLGRPSSTATGPAIFALKSGCPIIFACCIRGKKGAHTAHFDLIDHSDLKGVTEENIRILTQRHATALEKFILKYPDHWFWMHRRWKTKPRLGPKNEAKL